MNVDLFLRGRLADRTNGRIHQRLQLARDQLDFQLIGLQPRQIEQVAEQAGQAVGVILDDAGEAARRLPVVDRTIG